MGMLAAVAYDFEFIARFSLNETSTEKLKTPTADLALEYWDELNANEFRDWKLWILSAARDISAN